MPNYKLQYFDTRGRGESIRMIFAVAKQPFEDIQITRDEWPKIKPTTPQGKIPVLLIDDKALPQTNAIESYLAREFGLYGRDTWEAALIDVVRETVTKDLIEPMIMPVLFEKDKAKQAENAKEYFEETAPPVLKIIDDLLKSNNGGDGYFVGDKASLADVIFFVCLEFFEMLPYPAKGLENYPKLVALRDRLAANELAKHLKERPQTCWVHD